VKHWYFRRQDSLHRQLCFVESVGPYPAYSLDPYGLFRGMGGAHTNKRWIGLRSAIQFRAPLFPKELVERLGSCRKSGLCFPTFGLGSRCFTWNVAGCCRRRKAGCDVSRETSVWWVCNAGVVSCETRSDSWGVGDSGWSILPLPYWLLGGVGVSRETPDSWTLPVLGSEVVKTKAVRAC